MEKKKIKVKDETVLVVGSMNGLFSKLPSIEKLSNTYKYLIINGNLFSERYEEVNFPSNVVYCAGDLDLLSLNNNYSNIEDIFRFPNVIEIDFGFTTYLVCSGGPSPKNQLGCSFVSLINEEPWHKYYNGKFGYIISNNPYALSSPVYYNYSCSIGHEEKILCQEVSKFGLKKVFEL